MSRTQRTKQGSGRTRYVLDLVGLVLVLAPLALGVVHIESQLILASFVGFLFAWIWLNPKRALPRLPLLGWVALVWLAWSLLLLAPWPSSVIALLSSEALSHYAELGALLDLKLSPSLTLDRPRGAATLVILLTYALLAMTVWTRTLQSRSSLRSPIPFYLVFSGVLVSVVCLAHTALDASLLYGIYASSVALELEPIVGPMVNPNHTAALLLLTSLVTFGYWLQSTERRRSFLLALCWALMCLVIFLSGSRANGALLVLAHLYLFWFIRQGRSAKRRRQGFWALGAVALIGLSVFAYALYASASQPEFESGTTWGELVIRWTTGWQVLTERAWLGHGPGNFGIAAALHTSDWLTGYLTRAHNWPIQLMAEWGFPFGLVLIIVACRWMVLLFIRTQDTPSRHAVALGLGAVLVQNMVDFSLLIPGVGVVWVSTAAWLSARTREKEPLDGMWSWQQAALALTCLATLAALGVVAYDGDARRADADLRARTQPEASVMTIRRVLSDHPADFHLHVLSSAVARRAGEGRLAHDLAQRAQQLAPGAPTALVAGAKAAFALDEIALAQASLSRLCHDKAYWRAECLSLLIAERGRGELLSEILKEDQGLTLALVDHLRQRGHREATTKVLAWARLEFPKALDVHEELVESWLRMPEAREALDALSVDLLAQSADEQDLERRKRLQRLGYLVQARLVERERRYLEARHLYEEAASLVPEQSTEPLLHAARVLYRLKDNTRLEKTLKALRASLKANDSLSRIEYFRLYSKWLARQGRFQASVRALHKALRINPRDPSLYDALAGVLEKIGDRRGADKAREKASTYR